MYALTQISTFFFFFIDTASTEFYTLSLLDALPILVDFPGAAHFPAGTLLRDRGEQRVREDRKSTRLNSSHPSISYDVFCLKKKKKKKKKLNKKKKKKKKKKEKEKKKKK